MDPAPFRNDLAQGPGTVQAYWCQAADDARIRIAVWPAERARGTVLLFPGRTEYVEKYGRVARDLTAAGYSVAGVDWRGQGFSDRLAEDRLLGHVLEFGDYQKDVAALLGAARSLDLPEPFLLLAHSMGGNIGFRALAEGLPVARAVFSAPMWGIQIPPSRRPAAAILPTLARLAGQGERYTPGSRPLIYDHAAGYSDNCLTADPDHFAYLARQIAGEEHFALSGPSLHWLGEALKESRALRDLPRPDVPALTMVGTEETVVSLTGIEAMHKGWPGAELRIVPGARHELMMETPALRGEFMSATRAFFDAATGG